MIAIIDYNMGNVGSVRNALRVLGVEAILSSKKEDIEKSSHIILPGVGAFGDGMQRLKDLNLIPLLENEVLVKKKPFLGICLGMQLMAEIGEEGGEHRGLGWITGKVRRFQVDEKKFRVPHIGWNDVIFKNPSLIFRGVTSPIFYFVHSYFIVPEKKEVISAVCDYGEIFPAAVQSENIFGIQFHPEKSQKSGLLILQNFTNLYA
jgi:imidazole glycerol-phosphate synthase subunit HisH